MSLTIAALTLPGVAAAQAEPRQFVVTPRAGALAFERASSIRTGPSLGVDATYGVSRLVGVGASFTYARARTRGEDFLARLTYGVAEQGDTSFFFHVTQPLNITDASLHAMVRLPLQRFTPYMLGGVGVYTIYLDPQVNEDRDSFSRLSFNLGAGVNVQVADRAGLRFEVRSLTLTNYDRDRLNPREAGRFANFQFPTEFSTAPAAKSTVGGLLFSLGFNYVPRSGDDASAGNAGAGGR